MSHFGSVMYITDLCQVLTGCGASQWQQFKTPDTPITSPSEHDISTTDEQAYGAITWEKKKKIPTQSGLDCPVFSHRATGSCRVYLHKQACHWWERLHRSSHGVCVQPQTHALTLLDWSIKVWATVGVQAPAVLWHWQINEVTASETGADVVFSRDSTQYVTICHCRRV